MHRRAFAILLLLGGSMTPNLAAEKPLEVPHPDQPIVSSFNIVNLNKVGAAALSGTPSREAGFLYAFDRRLATVFTAREPGPAYLDVVFNRPRMVQNIRFQTPEAGYHWTLLAGDSVEELAKGAATVQTLARGENRLQTDAWQDVKLPKAIPMTALRLSVEPEDKTQRVRISELQIIGEQYLQAISLKSKSPAIDLNAEVPLELEGYFTGGETRLITSKNVRWTVTPTVMARVNGHQRIQGRRRGALQVSAGLGKLESPPLPLVVE